MDQQRMEHTRRALHGVAELVLAGPQYDTSQDIRLRVTPGGFGTVASPDLRIDRVELVTPNGRSPSVGRSRDSPKRPGSTRRAPRRVCRGTRRELDEPVVVHPDEAAVILAAFATGGRRATDVRGRTRSRCSGPSTSTSASPWPR